jgi:hypothetical protein
MDIPSDEPREVILGDTIQWQRPDLSGTYPPSIWTLTYYFVSRSPALKFQIVATNSGGIFLADLSAASGVASSFERIGQSGYEWTARVESGGVKAVVDHGFMSIAPDVATLGAGTDRRSWAVRTRDALKAVIEGRADADVNEYMLGGKQVVKMTPKELQDWYAWISAMAQDELAEIDPEATFQRYIKVGLHRGY